MSEKRERLIGRLITVFAFIVFIAVTAFTLFWANGLRYDPLTGTFEQTSVVSVEAQLNNVSIVLNGQQIATEAPMEKRSLEPGRYDLLITEPNYQSFEQVFNLEAGQVHIVDKDLVLLAQTPRIDQNVPGLTYYSREAYDVGLTVSDGEIDDNGALITRLSSNPIIVRRINDGYIYQQGTQLRIYLPDGNRDSLIYNLPNTLPAKIDINTDSWIVDIFDQSNGDAEVVHLTQPSGT
jgi:hypothetical protein